jgi:hypothetical protein
VSRSRGADISQNMPPMRNTGPGSGNHHSSQPPSPTRQGVDAICDGNNNKVTIVYDDRSTHDLSPEQSKNVIGARTLAEEAKRVHESDIGLRFYRRNDDGFVYGLWLWTER